MFSNCTGVIHLTADVDLAELRSGELSLEVVATDGGHPAQSSVATLRLVVDGLTADNMTLLAASSGVAHLLRSALSSNRLATVLAVLLASVVLTTAIVLLCTVVVDRRRYRSRRVPDTLSVDCPYCCCMTAHRRKHRQTPATVFDAFKTTRDNMTAGLKITVRPNLGCVISPCLDYRPGKD